MEEEQAEAIQGEEHMNTKTFEAIEKLKEVELELHRLKNALEMANKALDAQPEQEPKCGAIIEVFGKDWRLEYLSLPVGKHKLYTQQYTYTTPPQRKVD